MTTEPTATHRRSQRSAIQPASGVAIRKGSANSVNETPMMGSDALSVRMYRLQITS